MHQQWNIAFDHLRNVFQSFNSFHALAQSHLEINKFPLEFYHFQMSYFDFLHAILSDFKLLQNFCGTLSPFLCHFFFVCIDLFDQLFLEIVYFFQLGILLNKAVIYIKFVLFQFFGSLTLRLMELCTEVKIVFISLSRNIKELLLLLMVFFKFCLDFSDVCLHGFSHI